MRHHDDGPPTLISEEALIHAGNEPTEVIPAVPAETAVLPTVLETGPQTEIITPQEMQERLRAPVQSEVTFRVGSSPKGSHRAPREPRSGMRGWFGDTAQVWRREIARKGFWATMIWLMIPALIMGAVANQIFGPDEGPLSRLRVPVLKFEDPTPTPKPTHVRPRPYLPASGPPSRQIVTHSPKPSPSVSHTQRQTPVPSLSPVQPSKTPPPTPSDSPTTNPSPTSNGTGSPKSGSTASAEPNTSQSLTPQAPPAATESPAFTSP